MLEKQSSTIATLINSVMWDDKTGIYRQVDASPAQQGFSPRLSPTSFYPMLSGIASEAQVSRLIKEHLTDERGFCVDADPANPNPKCPFAMPSISRADPSFFDNTYVKTRPFYISLPLLCRFIDLLLSASSIPW